jgi:small subunit ribosomal protein S25
MRGPAPWRRSLQYLENGKLTFRENVKIFQINYHDTLPESDGLRRFIFWHLAQVQYKNPKVQCVQLKNVTYTPYISIYTAREKVFHKLDVNCYKRSHNEILDWLVKIAGKDQNETNQEKEIQNPANFVCSDLNRYCICQIPGQVSCPQYKPLPLHMRGKYRYIKKDELEEHRKTKSDEKAIEEYWSTP